jgi:hypothetical protein
VLSATEQQLTLRTQNSTKPLSCTLSNFFVLKVFAKWKHALRKSAHILSALLDCYSDTVVKLPPRWTKKGWPKPHKSSLLIPWSLLPSKSNHSLDYLKVKASYRAFYKEVTQESFRITLFCVQLLSLHSRFMLLHVPMSWIFIFNCMTVSQWGTFGLLPVCRLIGVELLCIVSSLPSINTVHPSLLHLSESSLMSQ